MSGEKLPEPPIKNPKVPMPIDISESNPMATAERHVGRAYQKFFSNIWYKFLHNAEFGLYPKEYNKRVHGHYLPWRNYGKVDTPLQDVKLGELGKWLGRRSFTPRAFFGAIYRFRTGLVARWFTVRRPNGALIWQMVLLLGLTGYYIRYRQGIKYGPKYRYH